MKKLFTVMLIIFMLVGCGTEETTTKFKIGVIQWAEHPALDDAHTGLVDGLESLGLTEEVELIHKLANGEASNANMIISQFVDEGVDLIYAIATPAAQTAVSGTQDLEIPIVFNAVTDAVVAGLVASNEVPGDRVTGVSDMAPIDKQLALIKEFIPSVSNVGVLYNTGEDNSVHQINLIEDIIGNHGMSLHVQGISGPQEIALATEDLVSKSDAIYIITDNTVADAAPQVVGIANEQNIPVFMAEAGQFDQGILASDSISYHGLGEQAANMVKQILIDGISPGEIPVEITDKTELLVSQSVADRLGIDIPDSILERASVR